MQRRKKAELLRARSPFSSKSVSTSHVIFLLWKRVYLKIAFLVEPSAISLRESRTAAEKKLALLHKFDEARRTGRVDQAISTRRKHSAAKVAWQVSPCSLAGPPRSACSPRAIRELMTSFHALSLHLAPVLPSKKATCDRNPRPIFPNAYIYTMQELSP